MARVKRPRGKKRLVLDIGTSAVRLCELSQTKAGFQLSKYHQREFNTDPALSEEERQADVLETITTLVKESKNRARRVNFGVPLQSVFTRKRALPPVPEHKVSQIVRYEIQQQIPFSLDQIALDYQILDRTEAGGYDVLMAAVKVDVVDKRTDIVRSLKRSIGAVDVSPIAAYNWLKYTGEFGEEGECVALIDLGASTTDIVIERDGQLQFPRSLNLGGNDVTAALSDAFGMTFPEAEQLKRQKGFAPTGDPQRDGRGGEVIGAVLNRLIAEINRTFAYFRSQPGGGPVSRVVVTGGGSCLRNMIPFLQRQLGMEVRIAQPLAGLAIGPGAQDVNEHPEQAAVALGLALRTVGDVSISLSLIPPSIRQLAQLRRQYAYWGAIALSVLLVMASSVPDIQNRSKAMEAEIAKADQIIHAFDPEATNFSVAGNSFDEKLKKLQEVVGDYQGMVGKIDDVLVKRQSWLTFLKAVTEARPKDKGIWLSSFESCTLATESSTEPAAGQRGAAAAPRRGRGAPVTDNDKAAQPEGTLTVTPFPGVIPSSSSNRVVETNTEEAPRRGARANAPEPQKTPAPYDFPNGVTIQGYAQDEEALMDFRQRLEEQESVVAVFLNQSSVQVVPSVNLGAAWDTTLAARLVGGPTAMTFTIQVQISGAPLKETAPSEETE